MMTNWKIDSDPRLRGITLNTLTLFKNCFFPFRVIRQHRFLTDTLLVFKNRHRIDSITGSEVGSH